MKRKNDPELGKKVFTSERKGDSYVEGFKPEEIDTNPANEEELEFMKNVEMNFFEKIADRFAKRRKIGAIYIRGCMDEKKEGKKDGAMIGQFLMGTPEVISRFISNAMLDNKVLASLLLDACKKYIDEKEKQDNESIPVIIDKDNMPQA